MTQPQDRSPAPLSGPSGPLYMGAFADPFVLRDEELYYAYGTGLHGSDGGRAFEVLSSPDLRAWTSHGGVLEPVAGGGSDYWAPEVARAGEGYFLYYSVGNGDRGHHLRVALAAGPLGPFHDLGLNLTPGEVFAIDPHPFLAPDGQWYLYFARDDLSGERPGTVLAVAPLHGMTRLGPISPVLRASHDWQRYEANRLVYDGQHYDWHTLEGPFVLHRQGRYHLLYSGGAWINDSYGVGHAVADHPLGPWTEPHPGPSVLRSGGALIGPGHVSVTTSEGQDVLVFHAWSADRSARQLYTAPLGWEGGLPRVVLGAAQGS